MRKSIAKSIYLGATALAFAGIAGATSASAKTYAKVTSIGSFKGNVVTTGSNAVATKAATLKGARTVQSGATLKKAQDADKTGNYNFRAYSVATTNRGSVYYKVVSFDKTVRGWIYGGNVKGTFAGGVKDFATTADATAPTGDQIATDGAQLWNAPAWTTYKVGRASDKLANGAKFTVAKAVTNSKSGDLYYQIAGTNTAADGKWIAAKDVNGNTPVENVVKINYVEKSTDKTVGSYAVPFKADTSTDKGVAAMNVASLTDNGDFVAKKNIPAGYVEAGEDSSVWGDSKLAAAAPAGSTLIYYVNAQDATKVNIANSQTLSDNNTTSDLVFAGNAKTAWDNAKTAFANDPTIKGIGGQVIARDVLITALNKAGFGSITNNDGKTYTLNTSVLPTEVKFGSSINLTYTLNK